MDSFGSVRSWVRGGRYEWLSSASLPGQVFPGCCQKRRRPNRSGFGAWIVYDVVLNPRRMGAGTACETVARLTECEEFTPTAESLRAMQNLRLASRVRARLATDPRTREGQFEVAADGRVVTVTGQTNAPVVDQAIEAVARAVDGVIEVRSKVIFVPVYPGT